MSNIRYRTTSRPYQVIPVTFTPVFPDKPGVPGPMTSWITLPEMTTSFEAMTPNSGGSTHSWKTFHHYESGVGGSMSRNAVRLITNRWASDAYGCSECWAPDTSYGYTSSMYGDIGSPSNGIPSWYQPQLMDEGFVPAPQNLAELKQASLNSMLPRIKSDMSLLNSLYELKDLKSLVTQAQSIAGWIQLLRKSQKPSTTIPRTVRELASGYLQYSFNLAPLYSDILAFCKSYQRVEKRLNQLLSRQGRVQTRHFVWRFEAHPPYDDYTSWKHPNPSDEAGIGSQTVCRVHRQVSAGSGTFHAQIEFNYNYSQFQLAHAPFLAFLDGLGVNPNPQIVWNAMKWTFVLDWVVGISNYLSQFKREWMEPQINIRRYLWSVSYERSIDLTSEVRSDLTYGLSTMYESKVSMPRCRQVAYRRQVDNVSSSSVVLSGLNLKEFSLGAALVFARKWRRRRR